MSFNPAEYDIPANYRHWEGDTAEDSIGPFFFYMDGDNPRTAFRVQAHNCNAHNTVHGGVLMAFADYTLCLGANGGESESVATVTCNNEFVAPANEGDLILGEAETIRRGRSIVFMRCTLRTGVQVILTSSAVIKRIGNR
ncbi:MAG TPA: thioesterase [Gammaproteobacteria bacterium]|uniref:PaaI family thioesterase n=1 Tax=OM182 bacterium TaxID=2510334 RepID=A0A520S5U3_9GAMM|nr:MAG: PaaI family thioesterase [OM182 bacterium]HAO88448.1 thioesterase [Gammaproteobacteria bacterium]HAR89364.1 thioesterase [Gammaproteobacteria bacterium]HAU25419.1 thioesterase [Gammaproteobacteria bacterium]HBP99725.1 thioesterase [Gammaproteobacteria bacterium]|tara:strand:+ start:693 stop:1112 length:420 start_codon:yes stop_codon:yes gene_type:complete